MRCIDADALIARIESDIKAIEDKEPVMAMGAIGVLNTIKKAPPVEPKRLPQPHKCVVYRDGECRYPIEACSECPKHEGMRAVLAERPKGKWLNKDYKSQCNCCRRVYPWQKYDRIYEENFCPNCGADMRGDK